MSTLDDMVTPSGHSFGKLMGVFIIVIDASLVLDSKLVSNVLLDALLNNVQPLVTMSEGFSE